MEPTIGLFYGITTTTLVVLSSASLAIFQYLLSHVINKAKDCKLGDKHQRYDNDYRKIIKETSFELFLLLVVVFISAISILLVVVHGLFDWKDISVKCIFGLNLGAISLYIIAFCNFIVRIVIKNKLANKYVLDVRNLSINNKAEELIIVSDK